MRHHWSPLFLFLIAALLALPARAHSKMSIHWHHDLESAKSVAKQTNRLVLVHFWTPSCGPCMALDQNVFNQPGVARRIETAIRAGEAQCGRKLGDRPMVRNQPRADGCRDHAGWPDRGQAREPADAGRVRRRGDGAPGKYASKSGQAFAAAAAAAPVQPQINAAYASLQIPPTASVPVTPAAPVTNDPNRGRNAIRGRRQPESLQLMLRPQKRKLRLVRKRFKSCGDGGDTIPSPNADDTNRTNAGNPGAGASRQLVLCSQYHGFGCFTAPTPPIAPPLPAAAGLSASAAVSPLGPAPASPAPGLAAAAARRSGSQSPAEVLTKASFRRVRRRWDSMATAR